MMGVHLQLLKMEESRLARNSCIKIDFEFSEIERLDVLLKIRTNKKEADSKMRDSLLFFCPTSFARGAYGWLDIHIHGSANFH